MGAVVADPEIPGMRGDLRPLWRLGALVFLGWSAVPHLAEACSMCTLAANDRDFPPIGRWLFFPVVWYLAAALLARQGDWRDGGFGPWWWRFFPLPMVLFVLFGVLPSLAIASVLTVQPVLQAAQGLRPSTRTGLPRWLWLARLGVFAGALLWVAGLHHQRAEILADRDAVAWALDWAKRYNSYPIRALAQSDELSLEDVRRLVDASPVPSMCSPLAPRLGREGDVETDVPRLLRMAGPSEVVAPEVSTALASLTGLVLPEGATPGDWQAALEGASATAP